jgi:putative SOS response-associated peptidase YedK
MPSSRADASCLPTRFTSSSGPGIPNSHTGFEVRDGELFGFAGLWERWRDPTGNWVKSCTILTTTPNAVTAAVHDRMPVIVHPDSYDLWLDPGFTDVAAASEMLRPYDAAGMRCYPVSARVSNVANDDAECSAPVEAAQKQARLF